jgi:hypothetical protein
MARSTFSGPVRSLRGFLGTGPDMEVEIGAATVDGGTTIPGIDLYQGKVITVTDSDTVFNLPSIIGTATSNVAGSDDPNSARAPGGTDTLTLDNTTRGGLQGTTVWVRAAAPLQWTIQAFLNGNGTFVTPWS